MRNQPIFATITRKYTTIARIITEYIRNNRGNNCVSILFRPVLVFKKYAHDTRLKSISGIIHLRRRASMSNKALFGSHGVGGIWYSPRVFSSFPPFGLVGLSASFFKGDLCALVAFFADKGERRSAPSQRKTRRSSLRFIEPEPPKLQAGSRGIPRG